MNRKECEKIFFQISSMISEDERNILEESIDEKNLEELRETLFDIIRCVYERRELQGYNHPSWFLDICEMAFS